MGFRECERQIERDIEIGGQGFRERERQRLEVMCLKREKQRDNVVQGVREIDRDRYRERD